MILVPTENVCKYYGTQVLYYKSHAKQVMRFGKEKKSYEFFFQLFISIKQSKTKPNSKYSKYASNDYVDNKSYAKF